MPLSHAVKLPRGPGVCVRSGPLKFDETVPFIELPNATTPAASVSTIRAYSLELCPIFQDVRMIVSTAD